MLNVIDEMVSYLGQGFDRSKYACAGQGACEIVSGYTTPQVEADSRAKPAGSVRKQVGILYADIAGPAGRSGPVEDEYQGHLEAATKILMANIASNGGRLVSMEGYAILAEFDDTDRALHCAINVQLAAREWNANLLFERQLLFRIGITQGDAVAAQDGLSEKSKCLAAYLEKLASIGGICISESVRECLEDHPCMKLVAGGKQYVKNLSVPVESFWIEIDTERFVNRGLSGAVKVTATVS